MAGTLAPSLWQRISRGTWTKKYQYFHNLRQWQEFYVDSKWEARWRRPGWLVLQWRRWHARQSERDPGRFLKFVAISIPTRLSHSERSRHCQAGKDTSPIRKRQVNNTGSDCAWRSPYSSPSVDS